MDLAKAINSNCSFKIIGIRPGEKLHEDMITKSDSNNTIEFNKYYVILPQKLTWNKNEYIQKSNDEYINHVKDNFEYNSNSNPNFLGVETLKELIKDIL